MPYHAAYCENIAAFLSASKPVVGFVSPCHGSLPTWFCLAPSPSQTSQTLPQLAACCRAKLPKASARFTEAIGSRGRNWVFQRCKFDSKHVNLCEQTANRARPVKRLWLSPGSAERSLDTDAAKKASTGMLETCRDVPQSAPGLRASSDHLVGCDRLRYAAHDVCTGTTDYHSHSAMRSQQAERSSCPSPCSCMALSRMPQI